MPSFVRHDQCVTAEIAGERIIMNGEMTYLRLDGVGSVIWDHLQEPVDLAALVVAVTDLYDVDPGTARTDIERFLASLAAQGCLASV